MCGIIGEIRRDRPVDVRSFDERRDRLIHRGPNGAGTWVSSDGLWALGHRRLSILDLSPLGHQPMISPCGRYVLTFNGEIYNYVELRDELRKTGATFKSSGDTEVVLAAYAAWGHACIERFNGMFALAVLDHGAGEGARPKLFIARDRAGKKPFYYRQSDKTFEFASELKALDTGGLSLSALNHFLALGYVPGDLCLAEGVSKLPPAHAGEFDIGTGSLRLWRYWAPAVNAPTRGKNLDDIVDDVEALVEDAVRIRMRSDVPVGVLLSGGLDSSLVAAAAARSTSSPIETFTIALPGEAIDESHYAALVARHLKTKHHVLPMTLSSLNALEALGGLVDEPIADSSILPTLAISKLTSQHVTVVLGGDGGDELFGGYSDYGAAIRDARVLSLVPSMILRTAAQMANQLPGGLKGRNRLLGLRDGPFQTIVWGTPYFDVALRERLFTPEARSHIGSAIAAPEEGLQALFATGSSPIDAMTRTHFGSILPDDFLVKVDRASMACSLEMRSPLLDVRLMDYAFGSIPPEFKCSSAGSRLVQKRLGRRWLPEALDLERKQGFSIPLHKWMGEIADREFRDVRAYLPAAIDQREVDRLIAGLKAGRTNGGRLFCLLTLALACQKTPSYLDFAA